MSLTEEQKKDAKVIEAVDHMKSFGFSQSEAEGLVEKHGTHTILGDKACGAPLHPHYGKPAKRTAVSDEK